MRDTPGSTASESSRMPTAMRIGSSMVLVLIGVAYFVLGFAHWSTGIGFSWVGAAFAALFLCRGVFNLVVAYSVSHHASGELDWRFHGAAYAVASFILVVGSLAEQHWSLLVLAMIFGALALGHFAGQPRRNSIRSDA
jgi:hypothetical protein